MPTLTIKKVPEVLYRRLKEHAALHHRSMNGEVIACLEKALLSSRRDAEAAILEAETLNRKIGKRFPDIVKEAKREGRT